MPSHVRSATIQAALLNVTSVIIAQLITRYRGPGVAVRSSTLNPLGLEFLPIVHFFVLSLLFTPPNVIWQQLLERKFPGYPPTEEKQKLKVDEDGSGVVVEHKLHVSNTVTKFLLDQTCGTWANNAAFIVALTAVRGGSPVDCIASLRSQFWSLQTDAYKLWPLVSLFNFLLVPPTQRVVVGAAFGLFWNVYLVIKTAQ